MFRHHLRQACRCGVDQVIGQMHEEWFVADGGSRAKYGVAKAQGRTLADIDAGYAGWHDALYRREQLVLTGRGQRLLQFGIRIEVVFDRPFGAPGDKDQLGGTGIQRLLDRVLNQRLVDDRQHFLRASLGRRQESSSPARYRKHGRSYSVAQCISPWRIRSAS